MSISYQWFNEYAFNSQFKLNVKLSCELETTSKATAYTTHNVGAHLPVLSPSCVTRVQQW